MRKWLGYLLVFVVLLVVCLLISVRFLPKLYVSVFNHYSSEKIVVEQFDVNFFPLSVSVSSLNLTNSDGETFAAIGDISLSAQALAWFQGRRNFWKAELSHAEIHLNKLPDSAPVDDELVVDEPVSKLNVHDLLSSLILNINDVRVHIDDQSHALVHRLVTSLNDETLSDYTNVEQEIDFSVDYFQGEQTIQLEGVVKSTYGNGFSVLELTVPELSLTSMAALQGGGDETKNVNAATVVDLAPEAVVDWGWMSLIDPVKLNLSVGEIELNESLVSDLTLDLTLDQMIRFSQTARVKWLESPEFIFDDELSVSGQFEPVNAMTMGADLRGNTNLKTSVLNVSIDGAINVNGLSDNDLSLNIESTGLPIKTTLDQTKITLLEQYFPIKTALAVKLSETKVGLNIVSAQFGESDIKGDVSFESVVGAPTKIFANLESVLLSHLDGSQDVEDVESDADRILAPLPEVVEGQELPQATESADSKEFVFTNDEIDWAWLETLALDIQFTAKTIRFNDINVSEFTLPVTIANNALTVTEVKGQLAGGAFKSTAKLLKQGDGVDLLLNLDVAGVVLEQLNFLPPEQMQGGATDLVLTLSSAGNSMRDLAQALDGSIGVTVGEGVIGNDSFELVGSDLILGLLNKLNPFAKKDKTTKLECAIVNLNIESGKINIEKSLALRTSKLTMVADGHVDLNSEKIKLSLTPKARSGVGVDVSSLVKFIALGGTLAKPAPTVTASGLLKSAVVVGAAVSTGGASLLVTNAAEKVVANVDVCQRASDAFK